MCAGGHQCKSHNIFYIFPVLIKPNEAYGDPHGIFLEKKEKMN